MKIKEYFSILRFTQIQASLSLSSLSSDVVVNFNFISQDFEFVRLKCVPFVTKTFGFDLGTTFFFRVIISIAESRLSEMLTAQGQVLTFLTQPF